MNISTITLMLGNRLNPQTRLSGIRFLSEAVDANPEEPRLAETIPVLHKLINDNDADVRIAAAKVLIKMDHSEEALEALRNISQDERLPAGTRGKAIQALRESGDISCISALAGIVRGIAELEMEGKASPNDSFIRKRAEDAISAIESRTDVRKSYCGPVMRMQSRKPDGQMAGTKKATAG